jgi:ribosomal protein S18 acetylase RimI-like enzyme
MLQEKTSSTNGFTIVEATPAIFSQLADFLNQNIKTHRHLDWFSSLDWIGNHPYLVEINEDQIQAVLCTTPENDDSAWVRVFGVRKTLDENIPWGNLLPKAIQALKDMEVKELAALSLHPWFETLLEKSGFTNDQNIVVLEWQGRLPSIKRDNPDIIIRPMHLNDLEEVQRIDRAAFPTLWQNSLAGLTKAFNQTGISTVALNGETIVGYQISTTMTIYGHLARLAVDPEHQRQGIAHMLVNDLLNQFEQRGFWRVTVNTQSDNNISLELYKNFGFQRTSEEIKVYKMDL